MSPSKFLLSLRSLKWRHAPKRNEYWDVTVRTQGDLVSPVMMPSFSQLPDYFKRQLRCAADGFVIHFPEVDRIRAVLERLVERSKS